MSEKKTNTKKYILSVYLIFSVFKIISYSDNNHKY